MGDKHGPTEWAYQDAYRGAWTENGLQLGEERFALVGHEVSVETLSTVERGKVDTPTVDFLFVDTKGRLFAMEMKRSGNGPKTSMRLLSQVSHRAVCMASRLANEPVEDTLCRLFETLYEPDGSARDEPQSLSDLLRKQLGSVPRRLCPDGKIHRMVAVVAEPDADLIDTVAEFQSPDARSVAGFLRSHDLSSANDDDKPAWKLLELLEKSPDAWSPRIGDQPIVVVKLGRLQSERVAIGP